MTMKEVEQLLEIPRATVRFYEKEGLVSPGRVSDVYDGKGMDTSQFPGWIYRHLKDYACGGCAECSIVFHWKENSVGSEESKQGIDRDLCCLNFVIVITGKFIWNLTGLVFSSRYGVRIRAFKQRVFKRQ